MTRRSAFCFLVINKKKKRFLSQALFEGSRAREQLCRSEPLRKSLPRFFWPASSASAPAAPRKTQIFSGRFGCWGAERAGGAAGHPRTPRWVEKGGDAWGWGGDPGPGLGGCSPRETEGSRQRAGASRRGASADAQASVAPAIFQKRTDPPSATLREVMRDYI